MCCFKTLASLWNWAGQFETYLVANPEDRFFRDEAYLILTREKNLGVGNNGIHRNMY